MASPKQECVGSLILPSRDLQELSSLASPELFPAGVEGVGTLILPSSDLQELGDEPKPMVNLKPRVTVGSLLLPTTYLQSPVQQEQVKPSLVRRFTTKLQGPPPPDEETENWAD